VFTTTWGGQADPMSPENAGGVQEKPNQKYTVRIAVDEVMIDAVVVDKKGRQITNLRPDDFVIYQDGKPQKVASSTYIDNYRTPPDEETASADLSKTAPLISPMPPKEKVRRAIVFVVDDLSMNFEHMHYARMSLKKFVESQMQPGDVIAILRTGSGGTLQLFSSDKRQLLHIVKDMRWHFRMRPLWTSVFDNSTQSASSQAVDQESRLLSQRTILDSQINVMRYCLRALRDVPGRKYIFFISAQTSIPTGPFGFQNEAIYSAKLNALADEALRAAAVIHTLDIRGLEAYFPMDTARIASISRRLLEMELPFSKKTGGIFLKDDNFFVSSSGIGGVHEELKGYYLLSYIPPENTFKNSGSGSYHRIRIEVKRPGSEVHSRDGFYGALNPSRESAPPGSNSLQAAILSPFKHNDLNMRLASGYAHTPKSAYFLRSWLHLDTKDLTFVDEKDDSPSVSLELLALTVDTNGDIQDHRGLKYDISVKNQDIPSFKKNGLDIDLYQPVKNPGAYYVRAAIRDRASGKTGSAYQFLEIPNLKNRRLTLSSIFIFNQDEDLSKISSGNIENGEPTSGRTLKYQAIRRSPAIRSYLPGESFDCMVIVYNAKHTKSAKPQLEFQFILFRDGKEYYRGDPEVIDLHGIDNMEMIPIVRKLKFGKIKTGEYVLQLQVREKQTDKKYRTAVQAIDFEIREKIDDEIADPTVPMNSSGASIR
jgi:VWFA-related protein